MQDTPNHSQGESPRSAPELHASPQKSWSVTLKDQTRDALEEIQINPLTGKIHLKNIDGRYGHITAEDLVSKHFLVSNDSNGPDLNFESADDLIAQGWAID